ncbi:MAG TPA: SBBP repeat-containing protein, partial [candidate division Zixibacteria bacterium]|nr:SBBP repeat-containing protein [candidate division Zixibacteria bacterium]
IGNDPSLWRTDVPCYSEVSYADVYPGIDVRYFYSSSRLEYAFLVNPGSDPTLIAVKWEGPNEISVNPDGEMTVQTALGRVVEHAPVIYQIVDSKKRSIAGKFRLLGSATFGFTISGDYDPKLPLVIDPVLEYSTYLGGLSDDFAYGLALDRDGYMYLTGSTRSAKFPTYNAYDSIFTGSNVTNVFVSKFTPDGSSLVYSTFLGGGGGIDEGRDIAVDADGSAYITGRTSSSGFPVLNQYDATLGGTRDAFVTKLSSSGTLIYSTFLGGSVTDEGYGIAVDPSGNAYVTGLTASANFPVLNAYDAGYNGLNDVFVTKLSPSGSSLVFSTFVGGSASEQASGIALDGLRNIYLTGFTNSSNFPRLNAYDSTYNGSDDIFVAKLAPAGKPLLYSTYLGGSAIDQAFAIAVGPNATAFITGYTTSSNFPTKSAFSSTLHGGTDAFVSMIDATGKNLVYSTFLGGSSHEYGYGIVVDSRQEAYVVGATMSSDFPTLQALDSTINGSDDVFLTKLQSTGAVLVYSTLLGGSGFDQPYDIALDNSLAVTVTGTTASPNFPLASPFDSTGNSGYDVFLSRLSFEERNCCTGIRGNVDGDAADAVDIADVIFFVEYSFADPSGPEPPCPDEADVDGNGTVDVADLIYLVDYMFNSGPPAVPCQ